MPMKALSFRQPWAELILQGRKTMDLRTYNTHYRGRLAIHASQTVEYDKCWENNLKPDNLDVGGIVGMVELVAVTPLDEATYNELQAAHLGGRRWRAGLYGWVLAHPERLPEFIPARGRTNLFDIELDPTALRSRASSDARPTSSDARPTSADARPAREAYSQTDLAQRPASKRKPTYSGDLNGITPEKPFALHVQPLAGATTDYSLTLRQRVVERPDAERLQVAPRLETIVIISGDNLRAVADHVIESLRKADYKATDLAVTRRIPFYLPEEVGVRLGLVFLAVKPLTKLRRVEQISYGIRQMPSEEAYYWYSKCTAAETAERAQKALRVLLAAE
jgi:hypothetical protein